MIDYFYKAQFLETDLPLYQRKISKLLFQRETILQKLNRYYVEPLTEDEEREIRHIDDMIEYWQDTMRAKYGFDFNDSDCSWVECQKINKAYYNRVKRLHNKVETMLQSKCVFLTITFDNAHIDKISDKTKRRYVQRMLNDLNCHYVANVDYGEKNGRIHYHALVETAFVDPKKWHYGNMQTDPIRYNNITAISKYICKLTNHAIKETTHGIRLLYDKK